MPRRESLFYKFWRIAYPLLIDFVISVLVTNAALAIILFVTNDPVNYVRIFERNSLVILGIQDFLLCLVCVFLLRSDERKRMYEGRRDRLLIPNHATFGQYIAVILFGTGLSAVINMLTSYLPIESETYNSLESMFTSASPFIQLIAICIIGPIAEELLFRGIIYRRLRDYIGTAWAAVLSGIIFGVVHGNLVQGIYAGLFGIVLALLYEHYGTIWIVIVVHVANNLLASFVDPYILAMPTVAQFVYSGICILCVCVFGWYIFGVHKKVNHA
jgi:membrane protease YdiL (CAAX protease family)